MKSKFSYGLLGLLFCTALPGAVEAHTFGAHGAGFADGLVHPFLGIDHLVAILAVGFWAAQLGGAALWRVPLAFLAVMTSGVLWAGTGLDGALVEAAVAGSVLALGLMIALSVRLPSGWGALLVAVFALFHGHAHGLEMPEAASPWSYGAGFLLATASLHLAGLALGLSTRRHRVLIRLGGAAIAATGAILLVGV